MCAGWQDASHDRPDQRLDPARYEGEAPRRLELAAIGDPVQIGGEAVEGAADVAKLRLGVGEGGAQRFGIFAGRGAGHHRFRIGAKHQPPPPGDACRTSRGQTFVLRTPMNATLPETL